MRGRLPVKTGKLSVRSSTDKKAYCSPAGVNKKDR
jgi:hypothetical protein